MADNNQKQRYKDENFRALLRKKYRLAKLGELGGLTKEEISKVEAALPGWIWEPPKTNTVNEWVKVAEELAKGNKGVLPAQKFLGVALKAIMRKYPTAFSHLQQVRIRKSLDELVQIAEQLAKGNNGLLPNVNWMKDNGYTSINSSRLIHPERFAHIPRESKRKGIEEHVRRAEKLAKRNRGILPTTSWLNNNGHTGLAASLFSNPEAFSHISREMGRRTIEEWVDIANTIAVGGVLPPAKSIDEMGYESLNQAIRNHPRKFAHLTKESLVVRKYTDDEWRDTAKRAIKDNGGKFPTAKWMKANGYASLGVKLYSKPELFAQFKRETMLGPDFTERFEKRVKKLAKELKNKIDLSPSDRAKLSAFRQKRRDGKMSEVQIKIVDNHFPNFDWVIKTKKEK